MGYRRVRTVNSIISRDIVVCDRVSGPVPPLAAEDAEQRKVRHKTRGKLNPYI